PPVLSQLFDVALFCSFIRASISGLKCLIRPCTGHAAPSAKAHIVCSSICFVSSHSMSISCISALPSTNLQKKLL
ncbi:hypothetical protein ALC57_07881, partial [Trachymyrmex cornetzi]